MVRVTLTEQALNAIKAGLELRYQNLTASHKRLAGQWPSVNRDFAIEAVQDALRDTIGAVMVLREAERAMPEPELPESMTFLQYAAECEAEMREAWGK